jgi:hypothetical protein
MHAAAQIRQAGRGNPVMFAASELLGCWLPQVAGDVLVPGDRWQGAPWHPRLHGYAKHTRQAGPVPER